MALADRTVIEIITALCPTLAASGAYDIYIDISAEDTDATFFGNYYNYAIALRAAHYYTIDVTRENGDSGLITSKQEGKLQVSYLHNMNRSSRTDLTLTHYGQRLHALMRRRGPIISISSTDFDLNDGVFLEADEDYL
jgi:hypothetical protein